MKKLSIGLFAFLLCIAGSTLNANAIGISIKVELGKRNAEGNCGPGRGICSITIGGTLRTVPGETGVDVVKGDAELKDNQLIIKLADELKDDARDANGKYSVLISKITPVDAEVTRKLGVKQLMILPGNYTIENNALTLRVRQASIKRDAASGLPTGK